MRIIVTSPTYIQNTIPTNHIDDFKNFLMVKNDLDKDEADLLVKEGMDCFGQGGFASGNFGNFSEFYSKIFSWKHSPIEDVYHNTYQFHSPIDFLRMLSYPTYSSLRDLELYSQIVEYLIEIYNKDNEEIVVVDYGAGLAQITITLSKLLKKNNIDCKLVFVDIERYIYREFLEFIENEYKLNFEFIDINDKNPYPEIPKFNFIQIKDVFEHVYCPENIVDNIECSIKENGMISATTDDEGPEMMHVSRDLKEVRDKIEKCGFKVLGNSWFNRGYIYQK
jgi:2-polyprenyl-3-methyl-5-hydroxy-6-metoxy-1,4-benzoquinol methylase